MIRAAVATLALLFANAGVAAPADGVRARLAHPAVLRGTFEQARHLQGFRNALVSQGEFVVARDRGVLWETRKPFPSTTVIGRDRLLVRQPDGSSEVVFDKARTPAASIVNALLLALLGGDLDTLGKHFDAKETALPDGAWRVELTPRSAALSRVFAHVVLQGDRYVRSVHLDEKGGDSTDITFRAMTESPAELQPAEAHAFE